MLVIIIVYNTTTRAWAEARGRKSGTVAITKFSFVYTEALR